MNHFYVACCLILLSSSGFSFEMQPFSQSNFSIRSKRNLAQFARMIKCSTGRSAFSYNGYGCWCGKGGSGRPVDATDRCCKQHDDCYHTVNFLKICPHKWDVYTKIYKRSGCTGCSRKNKSCQMAVCMCDGAAAKCFARSSFSRRYVNYNKKKYCR